VLPSLEEEHTMRHPHVEAPLRKLVTLAALGLACACGASANDGYDWRNNSASGSGTADNNLASGTPGSDTLGGSSGTTDGGVDTSGYNVPDKLGCSTRAQDILILDFRSGWWAGGGGGTFYTVALPAVVGACPDTSADYHHFELDMHVKCTYATGGGGGCQNLAAATTVEGIRATFQKPSVSDYTQIWVLSGSDSDPSDIPVGNALFQGIVGDTTGACIPMLVAAGDGFVTHANTVSTDLGMGSVFTARTSPPGFFSVAYDPASAASSIGAAQLGKHVLLTGVTGMVDTVRNSDQLARGDGLVASVPSPTVYDVIARDGSSVPTIAVGAAKLSGDAYRPFIFDAGWQRMYALGQDAGTAQYLKNIVMYLSLVGCKAAPIATPR
jgi:hypothetical protein